MAAAAMVSAAVSAQSEVGVRLSDGPGGTTCRLISAVARIPWQNNAGDWRDAEGVAQGSKPFGVAKILANPLPLFVELDATALVRSALTRHRRSADILLHMQGGDGRLSLHSRESRRPTLRPELILKLAGGSSVRVPAEADTALDCSTYTSLGGEPSLTLDGRGNSALSFPLPPDVQVNDVVKATLWLAVQEMHGSVMDVGAFEAALPSFDTGLPIPGIASRYKNDVGLERDPAVLFTEDFESLAWRLRWGKRLIRAVRLALSSENPMWLMWGVRWFRGHFETIDANPELRFEPLVGKALRVTITRGKQLGLDLRYYFHDQLGFEPEQVYMRYYLRFSDDWQPADGGKLPGLAGTYGRAGWGDRAVDGTNGWSLRGTFAAPGPKGDQFEGLTPIGSYPYLADAESTTGATWGWYYRGLGVLEKNRWYCIEQFVKLNTPGRENGEFKAWIDGRPAFEKTGLRFRDTETLKIETAWFDVYFGGLNPTEKNLHLYIDNVVIAKSYIGPMRRQEL